MQNNLKIGKDAPQTVRAFIEISKGSRAKYELDKESGLLRLDRILDSSIYYPANYGFIPESLVGDDDTLDILVLCQIELVPASLVDAVVIGVIKMSDDQHEDDKIIAVAKGDLSVAHIKNIKDLPIHFEKELVVFFEEYKKLEGKLVIIQNILDKDRAIDIIKNCQENYIRKQING